MRFYLQRNRRERFPTFGYEFFILYDDLKSLEKITREENAGRNAGRFIDSFRHPPPSLVGEKELKITGEMSLFAAPFPSQNDANSGGGGAVIRFFRKTAERKENYLLGESN